MAVIASQLLCRLYRRYQTYVRNYGDNKIFKIACGLMGWLWLDGSVAERGLPSWMASYIIIPLSTWENKGSATNFDEEKWFVPWNHSLWKINPETQHYNGWVWPRKSALNCRQGYLAWCRTKPNLASSTAVDYRGDALVDSIIWISSINIVTGYRWPI